MRFSLTSSVLFLLAADAASTTHGFAFVSSRPSGARASNMQLYGLFDGVKDAFGAPAMERSTISSERETPIDRWMGWSVVSSNEKEQGGSATPVDFVDAMDESNYVTVQLTKPMGIVFEENDQDYGGIFIQSLKEDGAAAKNGVLQPGDQLVAVNDKKVCSMPFDDALGAIVDSQGDSTTLTLFRGPAKQFYGKTGASQAWVDDFIRNKMTSS